MLQLDLAWLTAALIIPIVGYTWAPRTWVPGELVTSAMMNGLRDLFNAVHDFFFPTQTFRGLTVRTHPDADVAASKVYLDHADEIVMQDGERVADWNDLVADITASGAGGLDTGAETASVWYEIHAIRKSVEETQNLLLHRAKAFVLDQSQTTTDSFFQLRGSTADQLVSQGFTPSVSAIMPFLDLNLLRVGTITGNVYVQICVNNAGTPGIVLATSEKVNAANIATTAQIIRFAFRSAPTLVAGTVYHIVINGDYAINASNFLKVQCKVGGNLYAGGVSGTYDGAVWTTYANDDLWFKEYCIQFDTAVTMPAGYDQRCLVGYVYNDSGSNFVGFIASGRNIRRKAVGSFVSGGTATIPTLVDMSALLPPVSCVITSMLLNHASAAAVTKIGPAFTTSIAEYGIFHSSSGAADFNEVGGEIPVEFQHLYYFVDTGTLTAANLKGFRW